MICRRIHNDSVRYMMLALENHRNIDAQSIGELFYCRCEEMNDIKLTPAVAVLWELMCSTQKHNLSLAKRKINQIVSEFFHAMPSYVKARLLLNAWSV